MKVLSLYIDGASRGNPGPSGIGVVIYDNQKVIFEKKDFIGHNTNNVAEYTALLSGLEQAYHLKPDVVIVRTDSELLCRQLKNIYKVQHPRLKQLYNEAQNLISKFKKVVIEHIPRLENNRADKLASEAIKEYMKEQAAGGYSSALSEGRKVRAPVGNVAGNTRPFK